MSKLINAQQPPPPLKLTALEAPVAGEKTAAAEIEAALQQLLNNDAALFGLLTRQATPYSLKFMQVQAGERQSAAIETPPIGVIVGVQADGGGRVQFYMQQGGALDDPARPLYRPPPAAADCVLDAGLGPNGGTLSLFAAPIQYAAPRAPVGAASVGNTLAVTNWGAAPADLTVTLWILPLGDWPLEAAAPPPPLDNPPYDGGT